MISPTALLSMALSTVHLQIILRGVYKCLFCSCYKDTYVYLCAGIFGIENTDIIHDTNAADITNTTCQVDFATINNQPMTSVINVSTQNNMVTVITNSATLNDTVDSSQSDTVAVIVITIVGGILGICIIVICIVGLIAIKNKRSKDKVRKEIIAQQSLTSIFKRYVIFIYIHKNVNKFAKTHNIHTQYNYSNWQSTFSYCQSICRINNELKHHQHSKAKVYESAFVEACLWGMSDVHKTTYRC